MQRAKHFLVAEMRRSRTWKSGLLDGHAGAVEAKIPVLGITDALGSSQPDQNHLGSMVMVRSKAAATRATEKRSTQVVPASMRLMVPLSTPAWLASVSCDQ